MVLAVVAAMHIHNRTDETIHIRPMHFMCLQHRWIYDFFFRIV